MTSSWPSLALVMAMAVPSQLPAQQVWELGGQALVTTSDPALVMMVAYGRWAEPDRIVNPGVYQRILRACARRLGARRRS